MAKDFLSGSTNKALVSMTVPISIGMLSTILFQVIDTYFVGQLGPEPLAALGFASTVYFLLVGLFIGLSVGVSVLIGKTFGAGEIARGKRTISLAFWGSLLLTTGISLAGILSVGPLFYALGAEGVILDHISAYMVPLYVGMPMLAASIVGGGALRATGNVKMPEVVFGVGGIINAILDYVFIFGVGPFPQLGIKGVAYGTVISWIFMFLAIGLLLIRDKKLSLNLFSGEVKNLPVIREIYSLGLPSVATQLVGPATLMFITFLLGRETPEAVAAFGIAGRIETLFMVGILAVGTAATPFIAQNLGAEKHARIDQAIVFGGKASFYLGILLFVFLTIFIGPIAALFSDSETINGFTRLYFYTVAISYVFYSYYLVTSSIFNGLQLPVNSLRIVLVKTLLFTVPLAIIGSFWGVFGIFVGISASNVLGGIYAIREMRKQFRKVGSPLADQRPLQDYKADLRQLTQGLSAVFKSKG